MPRRIEAVQDGLQRLLLSELIQPNDHRLRRQVDVSRTIEERATDRTDVGLVKPAR